MLVQVQIYSLVGRVIKTIEKTINTPGNRSSEVEWDAKDEFGDKVARGMYLYRIRILSHGSTPGLFLKNLWFYNLGAKKNRVKKSIIINSYLFKLFLIYKLHKHLRMKSTALKLTVTIFLFLGFVPIVQAQVSRINVVTTAVPFLRISPDARAAGMGELALATSPDANSSFWNLGKVPFNENKGGISISYAPWLKEILNDVYLTSVAGFYRVNEQEAISGSLRYFNLGSIQFTDALGQDLNTFRPREFGLDAAYSRKLSDKSGIGVGLKYIYSNLASGNYFGNTYKAASAVAGDIHYFYNGHNDQDQGWAFGAALSNLGSKIAYTNNANQKDYIPANLGLGTTYTRAYNSANKITFGIDLNKLLVPTPPGEPFTQAQLNDYRNKTVVGSWFSSFGDAPNGFSEELKEFQVSTGAEYMYNNQFALRTGYFYENKLKGNRRYFTMGVGLKYSSFGLDFSYLFPTGSGVDRNPLSNTLRFSLHFNFDGTGATTTGK